MEGSSHLLGPRHGVSIWGRSCDVNGQCLTDAPSPALQPVRDWVVGSHIAFAIQRFFSLNCCLLSDFLFSLSWGQKACLPDYSKLISLVLQMSL